MILFDWDLEPVIDIDDMDEYERACEERAEIEREER